MKGMVIALICGVILFAIVPAALFKMKGKRFFALSLAFLGVSALFWLASKALGFGVTENLTTSLPGSLYIHFTGKPFAKGDAIAYHWHGGATYPKGKIFIKHVVGVPGDVVKVEGRNVWVNNKYIGVAKPFSRARVPLSPTKGGTIPPGEYFVATPSPDSLDSRYSLSGNIKSAEIIGRAYAIF